MNVIRKRHNHGFVYGFCKHYIYIYIYIDPTIQQGLCINPSQTDDNMSKYYMNPAISVFLGFFEFFTSAFLTSRVRNMSSSQNCFCHDSVMSIVLNHETLSYIVLISVLYHAQCGMHTSRHMP